MSQRQELVERIARRLPQADFGDVRRLLEAFGWSRDRQKGSHVTFVKPGERPTTVPVHNDKVGRRYLDDICERPGRDADD